MDQDIITYYFHDKKLTISQASGLSLITCFNVIMVASIFFQMLFINPSSEFVNNLEKLMRKDDKEEDK